MEYAIEEYIWENSIIKIWLSKNQSEIYENYIFLYYLTLKNDEILQKFILSNKCISVEFHYELDSYKNIDILSYANKISVYHKITSKNLIDLIHYSVNLQKLTIRSYHISKIDVKNKLYEKEFLKYIKIMFSSDVNVDDIYEIMKMKTLHTLCLREYKYDNYFNSEIIFKILSYIVNMLNKNIKIVLCCNGQNDIFKKYISLMTYNFKIYDKNYIFTYITPTLRKFDNLYDFYLRYR